VDPDVANLRGALEAFAVLADLYQDALPNKPLEWTGHHPFIAAPPQALCLPLRGSVGRTEGSI